MFSSTSVLVEVETIAAGASRTVGMTSVEVLPERGGPMINVADSGPAQSGATGRKPSGGVVWLVRSPT